MFTIGNHPSLPLYVYYGDGYEDAFIGSFSCCALGVHSFTAEELMGFNVCPNCGQIAAVFELVASEREESAGSIYTMINIENVCEFAACKTVGECDVVANFIINGIKRAA